MTGELDSEFSISIALVTRNRPDSLRRCLQSWRSQSVQPYEILVSDDSDNSFREDVRSIAAEFGTRVIDGPRRGLYANRNHVASRCTGSHILSSDDDHEHPQDLIEKCMEAIRRDPDSAWCLGEVGSWEDVSRGWYPPGELSVTGGSLAAKDPNKCMAWSDGATLFPKHLFDRGLHFSEAFRFGSSYLEFGCLLYAAGQRIRILDGTGVVHHYRDTGRSFQIPVEERASWHFAILMLALVYQPTVKNRLLMAYYFLKEGVLRPVILARSLPWALRAQRERTGWYRSWCSSASNEQRLAE